MKKFAFRELKVRQKALDFANYAISLSENLQAARQHYRLIEQFEAASDSVAMNIAEGKGRNSKKEYDSKK